MVDEKPVCPQCRSNNHYKRGFTARRKQRYQCYDCGRHFISPENHVPKWSGNTCPHCQSIRTIWYGRTLLTGGRQRRRVKCKDCNKSFHQPEEAEGGR